MKKDALEKKLLILRFHNRRALSLTELLVASMLIGIVMTGVMGFNFAIQSIEQTSDVDTKATINAASIASFMRRDAMLAAGNLQSPGVLFYISTSPNFASICMRHDTSSTPLNYADDDWICYAHDASFNLMRCAHTNVGSYLIDNQSACQSLAQCCTQSNEQLEMGALDSTQYDLTSGDAFFTVTGTVETINLNINTVMGNTGGGPLDFSRVNFTTSVNPPMHGSI